MNINLQLPLHPFINFKHIFSIPVQILSQIVQDQEKYKAGNDSGKYTPSLGLRYIGRFAFGERIECFEVGGCYSVEFF